MARHEKKGNSVPFFGRSARKGVSGMGELIDRFAYYALTYRDLELEDVFNRFLRTLPDGEGKETAASWFALFLETGRAAREAPAPVREKIMQKGRPA